MNLEVHETPLASAKIKVLKEARDWVISKEGDYIESVERPGEWLLVFYYTPSQNRIAVLLYDSGYHVIRREGDPTRKVPGYNYNLATLALDAILKGLENDEMAAE